MVKISKAPPGLYTAKQAMTRLGMKQGTFFYHVRQGKIDKAIPPGSTEGYYHRDQIDKMALEKELFWLQYAVSPTSYERANVEEDIRGIYDLCIAMYGQGGTPSLEARLDIWRKFPETYYVVKRDELVAGYISLIWFNDEALKVLMGEALKPSQVSAAGTGVYSVTGPQNMIAFKPGCPIESLFISLAVRPGLTNSQQRRYGFKLLRDTVDVLEDLARHNMPVRKLYATSERQDGIKLARDMGMREIKYPGDPLLRFELDLETADTPIARNYQELRRSLQSHQEALQTPVRIQPLHTTPQRTQATTTTRTTRHITDTDQPPATITLQEFADQLHLSRTSLREYVLKHNLPHVQIPNASRPGETKRYFSQEDQEAYHRYRGQP